MTQLDLAVVEAGKNQAMEKDFEDLFLRTFLVLPCGNPPEDETDLRPMTNHDSFKIIAFELEGIMSAVVFDTLEKLRTWAKGSVATYIQLHGYALVSNLQRTRFRLILNPGTPYFKIFEPDEIERLSKIHLQRVENDFSIARRIELDLEINKVFERIANGLVFQLTGADSIKFNFSEAGEFKLDFANRGSICGSFTRIRPPNFIELSWEVTGFGRPNENSSVTLGLTPYHENKTILEFTHRGIQSADSLQAKARAWTEILLGLKSEFRP